ncbi:DUF3048 domain-containing protein [Cellulomonas endophytica]|uniref:DUF3048 domain-containing protein n=1 Tax=Cellulomonas endophytica TaxID=2494735 RepID=UPI001F0CB46F|nr:DUF3048 domain-containing protein [Cellulomonas endophytica]
MTVAVRPTAVPPAAAPRRPRRTALAALAALVVLAPAACSGDDGAAAPTTTATVRVPGVVEPTKAAPPEPAVPVVWPLTGVGTDAVAARPALAVKIENSAVARPQTGLEQADVVVEEVVEGGITRFIAVYHSQVPGEVGPIRSIRPMDADLMAPLHGLLAFSGGQPQFVQRIQDAGVQVLSMDAGAPGFYRKRGVAPAPHNVYGTPETFWGQAAADRTSPPAPLLPVALRADAATAAQLGTPAASLTTTFSRSASPGWTWDGASGTWLRSEGPTASVSASGARLAATNVLALRVQVNPDVGRDPAGNPIPETIVANSGGDGLLASGGKVLPVRWSMGATGSPLAVTTDTGAAVTLAPGTTWVELVPVTTGAITTG